MKCYFHSADYDGMCSGALVKLAYPECEMIGINYGQDFPWDSIEKGELVFMVDFCLGSFSDMYRLNHLADLYWIDHHKTAIDQALENNFMARAGQVLEVGRAACELVWETLHPDIEIPRSVYLLGRYDVWDHSDPDTLPFQWGMRTYSDTHPDNTKFWYKVIYSSQFLDFVVEKGRIILEYEEAQNKKFCKAYAFETEFNSLRAICINRGFTNSQIFESVYDPNVHDLMITFCRLKLPKRQWTVSLYTTKDDIDCGAMAKALGGGGHKQAAGFQCRTLPFDY